MRPHPPLPFSAAILLASSASAQVIVPASQARSIQAFTEDCIVSELRSDQASGFGTFSSAVFTTLPALESDSFAAQVSRIGPTEITALCGASGIVRNDCTFTSYGCSDATADSAAIVTFDLTGDARFCLRGELQGFTSGEALANLADANGNRLAEFTTSGYLQSFEFATSGVLPAGQYTLEVLAEWATCICDGSSAMGFADADVTFSIAPVPVNFCIAAPNSAQAGGATLSAAGSLAGGDFQVTARDAVPNGAGLLFFGPARLQYPFGDGFRCVGGKLRRLNPLTMADPQGVATVFIDASIAPGALTPGSTWSFQYWYMDPAGPGGTGFNFSDGLEVAFCP